MVNLCIKRLFSGVILQFNAKTKTGLYDRLFSSRGSSDSKEAGDGKMVQEGRKRDQDRAILADFFLLKIAQ